jgi:hypothetical protein
VQVTVRRGEVGVLGYPRPGLLPDKDQYAPSQWEMYDLLRDPLEKENLAYKGYQRTQEQQIAYDRLQLKLQDVKATRLQPFS